MSDVPIKVVCCCNGSGKTCDPCMQQQFDALLEQCRRDPECQDRPGLDVLRPEGREGVIGSMISRDPKAKPVDGSETWRSISERLSALQNDDAALDRLAAKLNNPLD